jgi:2-amino-4-hydroxy-6-hydroxymethyldihydropteridine diphosphokinase
VTKIYLSLGSNIGDRAANIAHSSDALADHDVRVTRRSALYETEPVDVLDQDWFLNAVVEAETELSPRQLIQALLDIESSLGRVRRAPKGPRIIDIDILFYGDSIISEPDLKIPHPRMAARRFVLVPLAEVASHVQHPILKKSVADILAETSDTSEVEPFSAAGKEGVPRSSGTGKLLAALLAVILLFSAAALRSQSPKREIAPDLAQRVAKFQRVKMPFNAAGLSPRERQMIGKLVEASGLLDCIFWRQSDPEGLKLYLSLASTNPQDELLRRYLKINGSRFDLIDDEKPFVGPQPMPLGRGFFPADLTLAAFNAYVIAHPEQKAALYDPQTIVVRKGNALEAVHYAIVYKEFLVPMAADLRAAADLSDDPAFAKFLRLRADALLNDNYFDSDIAWIGLQNPKFDVIFAPYETYLDSFLGVKTSYGASVMIRNEEESRKLAVFQKYVPDLQESLPLAPEDLPSKRGKQTPMEVMDGVYRAGDLLHGYQAVADNLPNDPRIQEQAGAKKIFWKNFNDARVNYVIIPLAKRVIRPDQAALASGEGYLIDTLLHEISHSLGPSFAYTAKGKVDIREAIGPLYSGLEEAKADVVGEMDLDWLIKHGAYPAEKRNEVYASYVAGIFRTVRFGIAEAHGAGMIMEFNYLAEQGAIRRGSSGLYEIDFDRMPAAIAGLSKELLEEEATGDRARTENWFKKYSVMPPDLSALLAKTTDVPVDIDPEFDFHPELR